ncbi:MAG: peptide ABC transporter ATP-binding protein, partial [Anaerolineae bacterium]|nr:peptide ABC transporter ATP-binding protein [Anaerolineae bacterium]
MTDKVGKEVLVRVEGMKKHFPITRGLVFKRRIGAVRAVDGVSFEV